MSVPLPDWWSRKDYAVLKAVQLFGPVKGRKSLHKILYFVNLKTDMFEYQWYECGPYSPELAYKIADHVLDKSLNVEDGGGMTRYDMSLSAGGGRLLDGVRHARIDSALEDAHALLAGMPPRRMELLASVRYILSCVRKPGKVYEFMQALKPGTNFTAGEVDGALQFLHDKSVIDLEKAGDQQDSKPVHA